MDKMASLAALLLYFALLLLIVLKEKKNHTVEDYFFLGAFHHLCRLVVGSGLRAFNGGSRL